MQQQEQNIFLFQLSQLPTKSKEAILTYFQKDLRGVDPRRIIEALKNALLIRTQTEGDELKQGILNQLPEENRTIEPLVKYLQDSTADEILHEIPILEEKNALFQPFIPPQPQPILSVTQPPQKITEQQPVIPKRLITSNHPADYIQKDFPKTDYFDDSDRADIDRFRWAGEAHKPHRFDQEIARLERILPENIRKEFKMDHLLQKRFETIFVTFMKDIRDDLETRQKLIARREDGGMGFSHELVDQLFQTLEQDGIEGLHQLQEGQVARISLDTAPEAPPQVMPPQPALADVFEEETKPEPIRLEPASLRLREESAQKTDSLSEKPAIKAATVDIERLRKAAVEPLPLAQKEHDVINLSDEPQTKTTQEVQNTMQPRRAPSARRSNTFTDVSQPSEFKSPQAPAHKVPIELIGPAEEFSTMTLEDLQREPNPEAFTAKILKKVSDLSKNNYANRIKAIKSWKKSPLYQQYVLVGHRSLMQGISVEDYLKKEGGFTNEQFQAIAALNQKLRF